MLGSLTVMLPSNVDQQIPQGLIVVLEKKIGENLIYCCLCFCNSLEFGSEHFYLHSLKGIIGWRLISF